MSTRNNPSQVRSGSAGFRTVAVTCVTPINLLPIHFQSVFKLIRSILHHCTFVLPLRRWIPAYAGMTVVLLRCAGSPGTATANCFRIGKTHTSHSRSRGGRSVAVNTSGCGPEDRGFDSLRPPHSILRFRDYPCARSSGDRASGFEPEGRGFESLRACHPSFHQRLKLPSQSASYQLTNPFPESVAWNPIQA